MSERILRRGALPVAALLVAGLASMAVPTALEAQRPGGTEVASAAVHAGGVDFLPRVPYSRAILTVSGNGMVFSKAFPAGAGLSIGLFGPDGQLLADGVYKWSLELVPDARAARALREAAAENGGKAPSAWLRQTGSFAVRSGLMADRGLREAVPEREKAFGGLTFGPQSARGPAEDDDAAVGFRVGVEESMRGAGGAAAARGGGALSHADRKVPERTDATAAALGQSAEALMAPNQALSPAPSVRKSIFDNQANGRPRSDDQ